MKKQLMKAMQSIAQGDVASVAPESEMIKQLPRTAEGLFDTAAVDADPYRAAGFVYPIYAAYETECNKKEGYPDLLDQLRTLDKKHRENNTLENTADFLWALYLTIDHMSPQIYEYYRELVDIFKENVKTAIDLYFADGSFGPKGAKTDRQIRDVIFYAGEKYVLLAEKYKDYCRGGGDNHEC